MTSSFLRSTVPLLALALSACVFVPRTTTVYDEACKVHVRQMTLDVADIGRFQGCANDGCLSLLLGAGVVGAASFVVSGSIAVVGNVVYWAEKQQRCLRGPQPQPNAQPLQPIG